MMKDLINHAEVIIARPGYTTIMELASLKKEMILFVPTPGQTEQLYLAEYMKEREIASWQHQKDLNIKEAVRAMDDFSGFRCFPDSGEELKSFLCENHFYA
jgi:UDP-N-acetylglucosamine:LPS N-acetylglucosamine transferase